MNERLSAANNKETDVGLHLISCRIFSLVYAIPFQMMVQIFDQKITIAAKNGTKGIIGGTTAVSIRFGNKDNKRHLPRFPDFFVTIGILSLILMLIFVQHYSLSSFVCISLLKLNRVVS